MRAFYILFRPSEQQRQGIPFPRAHTQPLSATGIARGSCFIAGSSFASQRAVEDGIPAADPVSNDEPRARGISSCAQPSLGQGQCHPRISGAPRDEFCCHLCLALLVPPSRTHVLLCIMLGLGILFTSQTVGMHTALLLQGWPSSTCFSKQNQGARNKQEAAECFWRSGVCVVVFLLYKR